MYICFCKHIISLKIIYNFVSIFTHNWFRMKLNSINILPFISKDIISPSSILFFEVTIISSGKLSFCTIKEWYLVCVNSFGKVSKFLYLLKLLFLKFSHASYFLLWLLLPQKPELLLDDLSKFKYWFLSCKILYNF